ncbi:MAG: glycosyltransferase [Fidelibacterota bacterium]
MPLFRKSYIRNVPRHRQFPIDLNRSPSVSLSVSIITPTFNRADELDFLIPSIQAQSFPHEKFEMIIVDDGSTDDTERRVKGWQEQVDFSLRYVAQANRGPGAARNLGMDMARGELFLFTDSDCEAHPDWVRTIFDTYSSEGFDACGGPDASRDDFTPLQRAIDFSMTSFFTTGGLRGHGSRRLARFYPRTHNMAMTRHVYEKVGGFGGLRHGQDIELSHRIIKSGARIVYVPGAVVYHRRRTSLKHFFRQVFNWGVARVNLGRIDRDMLEPLHFVPAVITLVAFLIVGGFLADPVEYGSIFELGVGLWLALAVLGGFKKRSPQVGLYLVAVIPIQVFGYGLGFMMAFVRRFVLGQGEWTGFTRGYYS